MRVQIKDSSQDPWFAAKYLVHPYQQNVYLLLSISISCYCLLVLIPKTSSVFTWLEISRENLFKKKKGGCLNYF